MEHRALYREWRPKQFRDVMGQDMIIRTLKNEIKDNSISHAYIFTGPRGTGKTSTAKIFAKAINCHNKTDGEPCNHCDICVSINRGNLNDVLEIDAASNNNVDEIRNIRDKVKYAPTEADYKVYIIDEVHMLSTGAFNALLKTLEEPPKNVVFILATTEPYKVPSTIISRTQRFDFHRINHQSLIKQMKIILDSKKLNYEEEALQKISHIVNGGMRDALSILDQVISFSSSNSISLNDVLSVTGNVSDIEMTKYFQFIFNNNILESLNIIKYFMQSGKDSIHIIENLIEFNRNLIIYKQSSSLKLEKNYSETYSKLIKTLDQLSLNDLYKIMNILINGYENIRYINNEDIYLETLTIKILQLFNSNAYKSNESINSVDGQLEKIIGKVHNIENKIHDIEDKLVNISSRELTDPDNSIINSKNKKNEYLINDNNFYKILDYARRDHLNIFKNLWNDLLNRLSVSQKAIMSVTKPVAADSNDVIISFQFPYLCYKAMKDQSLKETLAKELFNLTQKNINCLFIPDEKWFTLRKKYLREHLDKVPSTSINKKNEQSIVIKKAEDVFGSDILDIKQD